MCPRRRTSDPWRGTRAGRWPEPSHTDQALVGALVAAERDVSLDLEPFAIDEGYDERARHTAAQRAVEAGFRLAAVLNGLFD